MKVRGSEGNDNAVQRTQESRVGDKSVARGAVANPASGGVVPGLGAALEKVSVDTMKFSSLGAVLRQELDPGKMAEERQARIAALKEQIRNGTYAPSSQAVAQSISEEISLEVLLSGPASSDVEG